MTIFLVAMLISSCEQFTAGQQKSYRVEGNTVILPTRFGEIHYSAFTNSSIEVHLIKESDKQFPSFAKQSSLRARPVDVQEHNENITIKNGSLSAVISKKGYSVAFYRDSDYLVSQKSIVIQPKQIRFDFKLDNTEKILGGGERVLGMNRRGHRMPLYNRAHYGYTTESNQMYYSLPYVLSSKKYSVLFDNSASGFLDIGKTEEETMSFEAVGGRNSYIVFTGDNYQQLINNYVDVTGKQPLPPRWAFGNFASRFGYKSQQQVIDTISQFETDDIPVDSIILDLYWFGNDIKGFMGNLAWDKQTFPNPVKMIADLKKRGIKTILVTEPFILSSSDRWQQAIEQSILVKDALLEEGNESPKRFDFYFGNTGLIDVFDDKGKYWFANIYSELKQQGVAGVWGDLGEPEVHPDDSLHFLSEQKIFARGDEVHNAYGHQWAKLVFENQLKDSPKERPFIMMRSGFAGSQRFGMIPWTGDVSRSWDGLKPQVELSLQMGISGLAYTHSDLGGFAGGEVFDKEMYIRWLQYGVFQPVYRPHAQDNIAPEPVFHDQQTKDILRNYIKLRYQLLPYLYSMAYQNSTTGMPLMRPLFFEDETNMDRFDNKSSYLWGDAFLVTPIVDAGVEKQAVELPRGVWFDYWNDRRYQGEQSIEVPVSLQTLPVLVRAGSFIPMVNSVNNTEDYTSKTLSLHYYADSSVQQSFYTMYEDDGKTFDTIANKQYELLEFAASYKGGKLQLGFKRKGDGYDSMPAERKINLVVHNWHQEPKSIFYLDKLLSTNQVHYDQLNKKLTIDFEWNHKNIEIELH